MDFRNWISNNRARWSAMLMLLLGAGIAVGFMASTAPAESRRKAEESPPHFKSGSERSLPILRDIESTLDRIDGRLERLEKLVAKAAQQQPET